MSGLIALVGGNEFRPECETLDRTLLARLGGNPGVVILPTAAAREKPDLAARNGVRYFQGLGAKAEAAMVIDPATARGKKWIDLIEKSDLIYFTGGDPVYLLETMLDSPVWQAALEAWKQGRMLAGSSAGAMIFGGQIWTPGAGWSEGLGLLAHLAVIPHHSSLAVRWNARRMHALRPEGITLIGIDEATALLVPPCQVIGAGEVSVYRKEKPEVFTHGQFINI